MAMANWNNRSHLRPAEKRLEAWKNETEISAGLRKVDTSRLQTLCGTNDSLDNTKKVTNLINKFKRRFDPTDDVVTKLINETKEVENFSGSNGLLKNQHQSTNMNNKGGMTNEEVSSSDLKANGYDPHSLKMVDGNMNVIKVPSSVQELVKGSTSISLTQSDSAAPSGQPHRNTPRVRCGKCTPCLREDCGKCSYCMKKKKFGGNGKCKNACKERRCINLLDRSNKLNSKRNTSTGPSKGKDLEQSSLSSGGIERYSSKVMNQLKEKSLSTTTKTRIKFKVQQKGSSCKSHPLHMYGKPILKRNRHELEKCAGCLGERNEEAKDDPVLLCDGYGCSREYHLRCVVPPITEVPEGEFFCVDCSQKGTASSLLKYFDECDDDRESLRNSREYVHMMLHDALEESIRLENPKAKELGNTNSDGDSKKQKHNGNNVQPKRQKGEVNEPNSEIKSTSPPYDLLELAPKSEVLRSAEMYRDARNDDKWNKKKSTKLNAEEKPIMPDIGPDFLVGKPLRLFNPNENAYHNGRIINWRLAKSWNVKNNDEDSQLFYGSGKISQCEFFVRFPAGMNGRKVTVHKWIILEEHSVAVTSDLVWAQRDKGKGILGWRPAQILLRSTLELVCIRKLLNDETNWALVGFFGEENYAYVKLSETAVDFYSKSFNTYRNDMKLNLLSSGKPTIIAQIDEIELACSLLMIEHEEQCRVFEWHKIPLKNKGHRKALTIKDESSLEPLLYPQDENNPEISKSEGKETETRSPKLCPLIEQGLDRLWIANLIGDQIDISLDTLASFRLSKVENKPAMIAQFNHEWNNPHL